MVNSPIGLKTILAKSSNRIFIWHEISRLLQICMETTWISLWLYALIQQQVQLSAWKSFGVIAILGVTSYVLAILLKSKIQKIRVIRSIFMVWSLFCCWSVLNLLIYPSTYLNPIKIGSQIWGILVEDVQFPPHLWVIFFTLMVIWRTAVLSRDSNNVGSTQRSYQFGMAMLLIYGLFGINPNLPSAIPQIILFLFVGLCALGCIRLVEMSGLTGGSRTNLHKTWLVLVMIGSVVLVGIISGLNYLILAEQLVIREIVIYALAIFMTLIILPATILLLGLTYLIIIPFNYVMKIILPIFKQLQEDFGINEVSVPPVAFLNRTINTKPEIAILITLLIFVIIFISIGIWNRKQRAMVIPVEEYELESGGWWKRQKNWFRRKLKDTLTEVTARMSLNNARKMWAAARIRWVYARLMDLAVRLGHPRPVAVTPREFCPILSGVLPVASEDLKLITDAYILVRYGEFPEDETEVERVLKAWKCIQVTAKPVLARIKKDKAAA